jgi:hypothetical protein
VEYDEEDVVTIGNGPEPRYESQCEARVTRSGRPYRVPDPRKKVIALEEDCGLMVFDVEFFRQIPGFAQRHMHEGNALINAEWNRKNLIPFRRPWRPTYNLPR